MNAPTKTAYLHLYAYTRRQLSKERAVNDALFAAIVELMRQVEIEAHERDLSMELAMESAYAAIEKATA